MLEIIFIIIVLVASFALNAAVAKYSISRVLDTKISFLKSSLLVLGRTSAGLIAGLTIGFAIKLLADDTNAVSISGSQSAGMFAIALSSFLAYMFFLKRLSPAKVSVGKLTKTAVTESLLLSMVIIVISVSLSTIYVLLTPVS